MAELLKAHLALLQLIHDGGSRDLLLVERARIGVRRGRLRVAREERGGDSVCLLRRLEATHRCEVGVARLLMHPHDPLQLELEVGELTA